MALPLEVSSPMNAFVLHKNADNAVFAPREDNILASFIVRLSSTISSCYIISINVVSNVKLPIQLGTSKILVFLARIPRVSVPISYPYVLLVFVMRMCIGSLHVYSGANLIPGGFEN